MNKTKIKGLSKDLKQFEEILKTIPEERKQIAQNLIKEICFMMKTLEDLRKTIEETGTVDLFQQGKQKFMRESPALKAYNTTIQRYSLLYKQLESMIPKGQQENSESELYKFINQE